MPVTLGREAGECYHLPKVNSQTSGGKEASYFSILDQLQAKSNRFPIDRKIQLLRSYIVYMLQSLLLIILESSNFIAVQVNDSKYVNYVYAVHPRGYEQRF